MNRDPRTGRVAALQSNDDEGWAPPRLATSEYAAIDDAMVDTREDEQTELSQLLPLEELDGFHTAMLYSATRREARSIVGGRSKVDHVTVSALSSILALDETEQICLTRGPYYVFSQTLPGTSGDACLLVLHRARANFGLARMKLEKLCAAWT